MENGSFHTQLPDHNFADETLDRAPSKAILKSSRAAATPSSTQILLQQIDDLQSRLKVSLERLAHAETELESLQADQQDFSRREKSYTDQLLIWKEKERLWLTRLEKAEQSLPVLEKLENEVQQNQLELTRYRKYHEKIRVQIKPYLAQLKDYSKGLLAQCQELNHSLQERERSLKVAEQKNESLEQRMETFLNQIAKLRLDLEDQREDLELEHRNQIQKLEFEHGKELTSMRDQLSNLKENLQFHQSRSQQLDKVLLRQDELNNLVVALQRQLSETKAKQNQDHEGLRVSLQIARNEVLKKNLQNETLEQNLKNQQLHNQRLQTETTNIQDQLTSLRYMWEEKAKENEKLLARVSAGDKLNLELSQRLNQQRREESQETSLS